jgi:hypothetical protein
MKARNLIGWTILLTCCNPSGTPLGSGGSQVPPIDLNICRLTGIEETGAPDFVKFGNPSSEYEYNSDGKVIKRTDDERGQDGRLTKTTYGYDGDTIRSAHRVISTHEGTQVVETLEMSWRYSHHLLDHIDFVANDSISGVKTYFYDDADQVFKIVTDSSGTETEEDFIYTSGTLTGYHNSEGTDYTYTFDDKVNPESFLDVNMEDPLRDYHYNITTRSDGYTFEYAYDASGEFPLERMVSIHSSLVRTDKYGYDCPDNP